MTYNFNRLWAFLKRATVLSPYVQREADIPLACDIAGIRVARNLKEALAGGLLSKPFPSLQGADGGYGGESRRWLPSPGDTTIATTGANSVNFNVYDFFIVTTIGFVWTVAGTVTALVMDFDLHDQLNGGNLNTDKLDATNGVITAPTVAEQAIGNVLYKELDTTGPVIVQPGFSIQAIVTTTTTAGNGMPFVLGYPKADRMANASSSRGIASS